METQRLSKELRYLFSPIILHPKLTVILCVAVFAVTYLVQSYQARQDFYLDRSIEDLMISIEAKKEVGKFEEALSVYKELERVQDSITPKPRFAFLNQEVQSFQWPETFGELEAERIIKEFGNHKFISFKKLDRKVRISLDNVKTKKVNDKAVSFANEQIENLVKETDSLKALLDQAQGKSKDIFEQCSRVCLASRKAAYSIVLMWTGGGLPEDHPAHSLYDATVVNIVRAKEILISSKAWIPTSDLDTLDAYVSSIDRRRASVEKLHSGDLAGYKTLLTSNSE